MVKAGRIPLDAAQRGIASDWDAVRPRSQSLLRHVGALPSRAEFPDSPQVERVP